jgi:small-conductance mechanosensitive channel
MVWQCMSRANLVQCLSKRGVLGIVQVLLDFTITIGNFTFDSAQVVGWLLPVGILVGTVFVGWVIEAFLLRRVQRTVWHGSSLFVKSMRRRVILWSLLLGVGVALPYIPITLDRNLSDLIHQTLLFVFIISLTGILARLVTDLLRFGTWPDARPVLSIITNITTLVIYIIGVLIGLQIFGISITPAIAALGVTGLAASLALQSTLTDLISGVQIISARQIQVGNYVQLTTGESGYVTDINWRTTTIRPLTNNLIIIPNSKLTSSIIINYFQPDKVLTILVPISVSYTNDLALVERITLEVAQDVMHTVVGGVTGEEPLVRYDTILDANVLFNVILRIEEYSHQYLIKHEFIKRLQQRYHAAGIELGQPNRSVLLRPAPTLATVPEGRSEDPTA